MDFLYLLAILALIIILIFGFIKLRSDNNLPVFTLEELSKYNGSNGKAYVGVNGLIFDCSSCESYMPGGSYCLFAGSDATVALARMSLKSEDLNIQASLTDQEQKTLKEWIIFYKEKKKYPLVGKLSNKAKLS